MAGGWAARLLTPSPTGENAADLRALRPVRGTPPREVIANIAL